MRSSLLIIIFYTCSLQLVAQPQLNFNHLTVNNGLSQGVNTCIYKDSRGYIWISSFDGLNRFDGAVCKVYRSNQQFREGLKGSLFLNILEDLNGDLWIGSNEGLNHYIRSSDRFEHISALGHNTGNEQFYSPFYISRDNNIWLQSRSEILLFNPVTGKSNSLYSFPTPGNLIVKTFPAKQFLSPEKLFVIINNRPQVWEGVAGSQILSWRIHDLSATVGKINSLLPCDDQRFWLAADNGILLFEGNRYLSRINGDNIPDHVTSLCFDKRGDLWAGTLQKGLFIADTAAKKVISSYSNIPGNNYTLSGNQVSYIYADDKDNLWIALWGKGVDYTSPAKFRFGQYVSTTESTAKGTDNFIRSIIQVGNEFWCGTQSGGILILDKDKKIKTTLRANLPAAIEHLYLDKDKKVWVATFSGLFVIDPTTKHIQKIPAPADDLNTLSNQYNFICQLRDGSMMASSNAGVHIIKKELKNYRARRAKGMISADVFLTSYEDLSGNIYLSRAFKGLSVYRLEADSFRREKDVVMKASIKCFQESNDSIIWIGSTIGLIRFNKTTGSVSRIYTTADGFNNHYIYGIIPEKDQLWISTNAGISRFEPSSGSVKNYTAADGLQSNEFNTYAFCKADNGEILFGGVNGLNAFIPSSVSGKAYSPQIVLSDLIFNDTTRDLSVNCTELRELIVPFSRNNLSFQFTVIDYSNTVNGNFSYTLEGYDKNEIKASDRSLIRYGNLPPGTYTLKARVFNPDGSLSPVMKQVTITILTPWWQTWWFRLLIIAAAASLMWFLIRMYYRRKIEQQRIELEKQQAVEKERTRIATDMHDDFGAGLSRIKFLSEKMQISNSSGQDINKDLGKISSYSDEMAEKMGEIVWALNTKYDTLGDLIAFCRSHASEFLSTKNIQLKFEDNIDHDNRIQGEVRRNIFLSLKECLNNVVKHSGASGVDISFAQKENKLVITIHDNGKGIDRENTRPFANGLRNISKRMNDIGGKASFENMNGTRVMLEVPMEV